MYQRKDLVLDQGGSGRTLVRRRCRIKGPPVRKWWQQRLTQEQFCDLSGFVKPGVATQPSLRLRARQSTWRQLSRPAAAASTTLKARITRALVWLHFTWNK